MMDAATESSVWSAVVCVVLALLPGVFYLIRKSRRASKNLSELPSIPTGNVGLPGKSGKMGNEASQSEALSVGDDAIVKKDPQEPVVTSEGNTESKVSPDQEDTLLTSAAAPTEEVDCDSDTSNISSRQDNKGNNDKENSNKVYCDNASKKTQETGNIKEFNNKEESDTCCKAPVGDIQAFDSDDEATRCALLELGENPSKPTTLGDPQVQGVLVACQSEKRGFVAGAHDRDTTQVWPNNAGDVSHEAGHTPTAEADLVVGGQCTMDDMTPGIQTWDPELSDDLTIPELYPGGDFNDADPGPSLSCSQNHSISDCDEDVRQCEHNSDSDDNDDGNEHEVMVGSTVIMSQAIEEEINSEHYEVRSQVPMAEENGETQLHNTPSERYVISDRPINEACESSNKTCTSGSHTPTMHQAAVDSQVPTAHLLSEAAQRFGVSECHLREWVLLQGGNLDSLVASCAVSINGEGQTETADNGMATYRSDVNIFVSNLSMTIGAPPQSPTPVRPEVGKSDNDCFGNESLLDRSQPCVEYMSSSPSQNDDLEPVCQVGEDLFDDQETETIVPPEIPYLDNDSASLENSQMESEVKSPWIIVKQEHCQTDIGPTMCEHQNSVSETDSTSSGSNGEDLIDQTVKAEEKQRQTKQSVDFVEEYVNSVIQVAGERQFIDALEETCENNVPPKGEQNEVIGDENEPVCHSDIEEESIQSLQDTKEIIRAEMSSTYNSNGVERLMNTSPQSPPSIKPEVGKSDNYNVDSETVSDRPQPCVAESMSSSSSQNDDFEPVCQAGEDLFDEQKTEIIVPSGISHLDNDSASLENSKIESDVKSSLVITKQEHFQTDIGPSVCEHEENISEADSTDFKSDGEDLIGHTVKEEEKQSQTMQTIDSVVNSVMNVADEQQYADAVEKICEHDLPQKGEANNVIEDEDEPVCHSDTEEENIHSPEESIRAEVHSSRNSNGEDHLINTSSGNNLIETTEKCTISRDNLTISEHSDDNYNGTSMDNRQTSDIDELTDAICEHAINNNSPQSYNRNRNIQDSNEKSDVIDGSVIEMVTGIDAAATISSHVPSDLKHLRDAYISLQKKLQEETTRRERADEWSDFLLVELDAHIGSRSQAEERYFELRRKAFRLKGAYVKLRDKNAELLQQLDDLCSGDEQVRPSPRRTSAVQDVGSRMVNDIDRMPQTATTGQGDYFRNLNDATKQWEATFENVHKKPHSNLAKEPELTIASNVAPQTLVQHSQSKTSAISTPPSNQYAEPKPISHSTPIGRDHQSEPCEENNNDDNSPQSDNGELSPFERKATLRGSVKNFTKIWETKMTKATFSVETNVEKNTATTEINNNVAHVIHEDQKSAHDDSMNSVQDRLSLWASKGNSASSSPCLSRSGSIKGLSGSHSKHDFDSSHDSAFHSIASRREAEDSELADLNLEHMSDDVLSESLGRVSNTRSMWESKAAASPKKSPRSTLESDYVSDGSNRGGKRRVSPMMSPAVSPFKLDISEVDELSNDNDSNDDRSAAFSSLRKQWEVKVVDPSNESSA